MPQPRTNDSSDAQDKNAHRTSRGYEINGQWYFELRGGGQKGPFNSEQEMLSELNEFIRFHEEMNDKV